ncbi:substrate-binding domain-containing protein [Pseudarthrobacter sp. NS4]|uniref:substrate-binding domain-containing protein n=1 Tax=Pseudarthrobacter sp. NS4 TaxID=2973976 RepID=UPI0021620DD5|nr:substrate-binding domain-containing protein [Pseudarthrobacter sp. NS4]
MIPVSHRPSRLRTAALLSGLLCLSACSTTPPGTIQGALTGIGSSAGRGAVSAWGLAWGNTVKGTSVSYSPDGSAAGLKAFQDGQAHFAVSSAPLSEKDAGAVRGMCTAKGALSIAAGVLPVGVAVKIKGVNDLILDAPTLAAILQGDITRWNDSRIRGLNPGTSLPDLAITVIVQEGPSDTVRPINEYLSQEPGVQWEPEAPDRWPSAVVGQTSSPPLDLADKLDDTNGGLSILDGSIIGNRFLAAQIVFDSKPRRLQASSVVDAVTTGEVKVSPTSVVQALDGRSGYALGTIIYVHLCREYSEEALGRLSQSFGENVLAEESQKNANAFAFVMSPSKKAVSEGLALVGTIGDGQ